MGEARVRLQVVRSCGAAQLQDASILKGCTASRARTSMALRSEHSMGA